MTQERVLKRRSDFSIEEWNFGFDLLPDSEGDRVTRPQTDERALAFR
jgi:hypothetical protein